MKNYLMRKKREVKDKGGHCCVRTCTETENLTVDHIIPVSFLNILGFTEAYKTDGDNLQVMCKRHNEEKNNTLDYTNPKTHLLLKKYTDMWLDKHSDFFIDPAKRVNKIKPVCACCADNID